MPPAVMTGLHTRPVTPTPQTAVSVCEAHFTKGDFTAFKLTAKVRSRIQFNINNKHTQAGLCLLQHLVERARARVTYWTCVLMFSKRVLSDLSWHHHPCLCGETAWLLLGNRARRRPRRSPSQTQACMHALPSRQGEGASSLKAARRKVNEVHFPKGPIVLKRWRHPDRWRRPQLRDQSKHILHPL